MEKINVHCFGNLSTATKIGLAVLYNFGEMDLGFGMWFLSTGDFVYKQNGAFSELRLYEV